MRDRITHRYFDIDHDLVWDTLTIHLPQMDAAVRAHLDRTE